MPFSAASQRLSGCKKHTHKKREKSPPSVGTYEVTASQYYRYKPILGATQLHMGTYVV